MAEVAIPRRLFADILRMVAHAARAAGPRDGSVNIPADHVDRKTTRESALMTLQPGFLVPAGPKRASLGANRRPGLPGAPKTAGIIRRRLERGGHMGNPG
jgi:hypothetical protein